MKIKLQLYIISLFFLCFSPLSHAEITADFSAVPAILMAIAVVSVLGVVSIIVLVKKLLRKPKK